MLSTATSFSMMVYFNRLFDERQNKKDLLSIHVQTSTVDNSEINPLKLKTYSDLGEDYERFYIAGQGKH